MFSFKLSLLHSLILAVCLAFFTHRLTKKPSKCPVSVNYHFTRQCNKSCGFCFHTASTSHVEKIEDTKRGLSLLKAAGMRKINFAGGEPFLDKSRLGQMIDYCKDVLHLESVSIVTNGSLVTRKFLAKHGHHIDILAISCDSFNEATNIAIGRGSGDHVSKLYEIRGLCLEYGIKFKINTVVCRLNFQEDMNPYIEDLQPFRWKCFQVLIVNGENESDKRLRDARKFLINDEEFEFFCNAHRHQISFVPESNALMAKSYLILDEYMRFLDRDGRQPSPSILEVGVDKALECVYWDEASFKARGGEYEWTRDQGSCSEKHKDLEW
ncbi:radical SAM domain-containing protein [Aspergillus ibericus CBS 121593]|uniref:Radical SAM domain-containing protein n=1 Tax=Aspergillus ibericus CBS 121593 TaxID=1448316 RepID=A0A395GPA2_9EURO|nr:radical SAM domain-containing protein [Aspergillus ibericus CBS 121593]RAK97309.1 radical SAM domain-containing protein [Aspergillus ibericus CBS 121593]